MTNNQIIFDAAVAEGLFTADEAIAILESGRRLPLHTYQEWKRLGYQVKKGAKAALTVTLWKCKQSTDKETGEEEKKMFMQKAHLFTLDQVEKRAETVVMNMAEIRAYNKMLADQRKARA